MKDMPFVDCLFIVLALASLAVATEVGPDCPKLCVCEIRPWFSPTSVYMEVQTVDCNDVGLFSLPERLPMGTQVLLLQTNNVAKIVKPLDYLANITEIDLSQNNLSSISDIHLGNLSQMASLHLEENWIEELPERCLSDLVNLQELYLNHNLISSISTMAFLGLSNLVRLHLNSNKLKVIKREWFEPMPNLEILMIGENPVLSIYDLNFKPLGNLRSLVLTRMNLSQLPDNALTELGINSMPELISIDSFALNNLPELTKIEATNNPKLSYIHPNAFYKLPRLETLMLNGNALSALHRITVESLPNLREVSMHSNPIRCDCVVRWMNMNKTNIRFMEPDSLYCVEPPEYEGQHVRQVHFREMMEICLPLISPESMPGHIKARKGNSVSLHCRAFAEPEPDIYWITPSGTRILPNSMSNKFYMHPEGTFDIYDISENEAGHPGTLAPSIKWYTLSDLNHPTTAFSTRVPSDIQLYNLSHLHPATQYKVCVDIRSIHYDHDTKCINVTTKGLELAAKDTAKWDAALITVFGVLLAVVSLACLFFYASLRNRYFYGNIRRYDSKALLTPVEATGLHSSFFTKLWDSGRGEVCPEVNGKKAPNILDMFSVHWRI
ncbi:hypothetical protein CCH79_00015230 [Gambusia affinis]|uniref:Ig-like domain-containing protein n=1 Tax=Gambusia affinis TaxID=33528 RepID=A0A315VRE5_GAMAF|nr:hypothetical protein CCH79_00015230 [Gambusia affinis]